jgi:hypothetical protein
MIHAGNFLVAAKVTNLVPPENSFCAARGNAHLKPTGLPVVA